MRKSLSVAVCLSSLALAPMAPVAAESHAEEAPRPIVWVSFLKAQDGRSQDLVQYVIKEDAPLWGDLLADGKILEWGIAQPITHRGNDPYDVAEWATFADWAAVDAFVAGFMARMGAKSPEEAKASQEAYLSLVVPDSHYDAVHQGEYAASDGSRPSYLSIGFHKAKPGMAGKLTEMWKEGARPTMQKLLDDGEIQGYGLFTQALHGDHRWTHGSWTSMSGLAGIAAVDQGFQEAEAMRSEEENKAMMEGFMGAIEWEAHWDEVLAVVHYENAQPE